MQTALEFVRFSLLKVGLFYGKYVRLSINHKHAYKVLGKNKNL